MEKSYRKQGSGLGWKIALAAVIHGGTAVNRAAEALTRLDHKIRKDAEMLASIAGYLGHLDGRQDQDKIYKFMNECDDRREGTENALSMRECCWGEHEYQMEQEMMGALLFYSLPDWIYAKWVESRFGY